MRKSAPFIVIIALILSCCYSSDQTEPRLDRYDMALEEIENFIANNPNASNVSLELELNKVLKKFRITYVTEERVLSLFNRFNKNRETITINGRMAPCSGQIQSVEHVDDPDGGWCVVYHYKDGSTFYRWRDANNNVVEEGCFGG